MVGRLFSPEAKKVTHRGEGRMLLAFRIFFASLLVLMRLLEQAHGQQLCPGSKTQHCSACPNRCRDSCYAEDVDHIKCRGSSWGNTNSTYMGVECNAPPGVQENYPFPAILTPDRIQSPLNCNGTIKLGQWPFDADNMTFTVDTTFRDPQFPTISINTLMLPCLTMAVKPKTAAYLGQEVACTQSLAIIRMFSTAIS